MSKSHEVEGKLARGVPKVADEIVSPPSTAEGTVVSVRSQNHALIPFKRNVQYLLGRSILQDVPSLVLSMTYQPPPLALNDGPNELGVLLLTAQPSSPFTYYINKFTLMEEKPRLARNLQASCNPWTLPFLSLCAQLAWCSLP